MSANLIEQLRQVKDFRVKEGQRHQQLRLKETVLVLVNHITKLLTTLVV